MDSVNDKRDELIRQTVDLIKKRGKGVALTGAGISAESGISTYRDPGALYDQYDQGTQGGMLGVLANNPDKAPEILGAFFDRLQKAKPNPGHIGLAELEKLGFLKSVITQNVDGLHRLAGNSTVYELHGTMYRLRCRDCGGKQWLEREKLFKLGEALVQRLKGVSISGDEETVFPHCECGGIKRFDFVAFGESVQDLDKAIQDANSCPWMLIVGTSGVVHPAASLPHYAKRKGAFLVEVNPRESELTPLCDIFLQGSAADTIPKLINALKER